jgi:hypothetical protein
MDPGSGSHTGATCCSPVHWRQHPDSAGAQWADAAAVFGRQLGPEACRSLLLEAKADAGRRLTEYEAIRNELLEDQDHAEDRLYWLMTVSAGAHTSRAATAWAEESLAALNQIDPPRGTTE